MEWLIGETISVLVENSVCLYFLNSRYSSKVNSWWPQISIWGLLVFCGLVTERSSVTILSFAAYAIMLLYLILLKHGTIVQKVFGILIICSIEISTSVIGVGLASFVTSTTFEYALEYQEMSRLLAVLFTKMMQVIVFYALAKKHRKGRNLQKYPALVLSGAAIFNFSFIYLIHRYAFLSELRNQQYRLLIWLAIGALIGIIALFILYELFVREEIKNMNLVMELQRFELESGFFKEIDYIYSDLRIWQHDYKNNLNALRALVAQSKQEKALEFIDRINRDNYKNQITLQTGNLVLDAIVSSKLWLAQSLNIEVSIQVVYPENNCINDNDLCSIVGNLIDNAIEACERMGETEERKFIDFLLMLKGKNLFLSVKNSFNRELKYVGGRYITAKNEPAHGLGIRHIDSVVKKYQGHVLRSAEAGVFETDILLPLLPLADV